MSEASELYTYELNRLRAELAAAEARVAEYQNMKPVAMFQLVGGVYQHVTSDAEYIKETGVDMSHTFPLFSPPKVETMSETNEQALQRISDQRAENLANAHELINSLKSELAAEKAKVAMLRTALTECAEDMAD